MVKKNIVSLRSFTGDTINIQGFLFGSKKLPFVAITGGFRGNHIFQSFILSQLVSFLEKNEERLKKGVLIIPAINTYGLSTDTEYWFSDRLDILKMFPGSPYGESSQKVAYKIFSEIKDIKYVILLDGKSDLDIHIPYLEFYHIDKTYLAESFNMSYIKLEEACYGKINNLAYSVLAYENTPFTIYTGINRKIKKEFLEEILSGIKSFLIRTGVLSGIIERKVTAKHIDGTVSIVAKKSGFFIPYKKVGEKIKKGEILFEIKNTLTGKTVQKEYSDRDGVVFQIYSEPLIHQFKVACRVL